MHSVYTIYIKGRDMKLSDFLSRVKKEDSHPNEVIPISFILQDTSNVELIPEICDSCRILYMMDITVSKV